MKRFVPFALVAILLSACSGSGGGNSVVPDQRSARVAAVTSAPSLVQRNSGSAYAPSSITVSLTTTPSVGHVLVVFFTNNGTTTGAGNTYTAPTGWTQIDVDTTHAYHGYASYYHVVASGETNHYVFTPSCACREHVWEALEFSGAYASAPVDKHAFVFNTGSTTWTSPTVTPSQVNDLAVVAMLPTNSGYTWTNAANWTVDLGPLTPWSREVLQQAQTGTTPVSETSTLSGSSRGYSAIVLLGPGPSATPAPVSYTDWSTFGGDLARTGYNPSETTVSASNAGSLKLAWSKDLGGAITAQPIVATNVSINNVAQTVLYIGAENGVFYALNPDTGAIIWQKSLGVLSSSCQDLPGGQFGITGAATYVKTTNRVYVADGQDKVHALDMSTGQEAAGWPVTVATTPSQDHIYGALTYNSQNGLLYAQTASLCDTSPWHGRIVAINASTGSIADTFYPGAPYAGAGIWGMGGASIDTSTNDVYVATGNTISGPSQTSGYGDAVVQLSASLSVLASNTANIVEGDQDYGATPMLYTMPGCPPQLSVKNKSGVLYTYNRNSIASGPVQTIAVAKQTSNGAFIGVPSFDPVTNLVYVGSPSDNGNFQHGLIAFAELTGCTGLKQSWKASIGPNTTSNDNAAATMANGVVYYVDGIGNEVFAYDAASGAALWNSGTTITKPTMTPPTMDGRLFVPSWDHHLYAFSI